MRHEQILNNRFITSVGVLFLPDQLQRVCQGNSTYQDTNNYEVPKGLNLTGECSRYFQIARAQWLSYQRRLSNSQLSPKQKSDLRVEFAIEFLRDVLSYPVQRVLPLKAEEVHYPIVYRARTLPLVIVSDDLDFDKTRDELRLMIDDEPSGKKSPFQVMQEFLNASREDQWGLVTNGTKIRLLRDSTTMTRPSYVECNIEEILKAESFADFRQMWNLLHSSRSVKRDDDEGKNIWDLWVKEGTEEGKRAREFLQNNVRDALLIFGRGFIKHPENELLRKQLLTREISDEEFMRQMLRMLYRFIFLFCLEERELLNTASNESAKRYMAGYSMHRFCQGQKGRRFANTHNDAWESVLIVFKALSHGEERLALPALGGLFAEDQCEIIETLKLDNQSFFGAMEALRWVTSDGVTALVDYKNMGSEEMGGVYEALLELVPFIDAENKTFDFVGIQTDGSDAGNARKETSSYYTPDAFVQHLLKTALDPVIEQKLNEHPDDPEGALLSLTVIDPACGSGHFLLAAARHIAHKLAQIRQGEEVVSSAFFSHALRQVIEHCIYGVDLNPQAVELARMALWLEGFEKGKPLSFLDNHLKVGNSLLGVLRLEHLKKGISKRAFKPHRGDDREVSKELGKINAQGYSYLQAKLNGVNLFEEKYFPIPFDQLKKIESMQTDSLSAVEEKKEAYLHQKSDPDFVAMKEKCDLLIAAYMAVKNDLSKDLCPTNVTLGQAIYGEELVKNFKAQVVFSSLVCALENAFHWPLEFPSIFKEGGFDCVLGNPPWDKPKIEDKKWFASRYPKIADASTAAIRKKMLDHLKQGTLASDYFKIHDVSKFTQDAERALFERYESALHNADAFLEYTHLNDSNEVDLRFSLAGVGDANLYAYFSELALQLVKEKGRIGFVVPTGILSDFGTQKISNYLMNGRLISFYDFENTERHFNIHSSFRYSLMTVGYSEKTDAVFYAHDLRDLEDKRRHIKFSKCDISLMNPNTLTCPILRSVKDLEISRKIYSQVPVLWKGDENLWGIRYWRMFDMANDSGYFCEEEGEKRLPLYEGKLIHQYDDRFSTYETLEGKSGKITREVLISEKNDKNYYINPRYWVDENEVNEKWLEKGYEKGWVFAIRDIARATDERTLIATVIPNNVAVGHNMPLLLLGDDINDELASCFLAFCNSLVVDYFVRTKSSGAHVSFYIIKQIPIISPDMLSEKDIRFVATRVAKLTRIHNSLSKVWLTNYPDFSYGDEITRLMIRAELDAYIARLYGLNREDVLYMLDPENTEGEGCPSVTFSVLKRNQSDKKRFGEYITQRLVMDAWDRLEKGELN